MSTFLDIATDALTEIGQVGMGQSVSAEQAAQAQRVANRMLQKWSIQRLMLYLITSRPFNLKVNQQDYSLGATGADFVGARPILIEAAQSTPLNSTLYLPMNILDTPKWGAIRDKGATCSLTGVPSDLWPEYTFPNLTFHVWPIPSAIVTVYLKTWEMLQQFVTLFDQLSLPPGYEPAIVPNLAMELAPYYDMPVSAGLAQLAADGLIQIQKINAQSLGGSLGESRTLATPNLDTPIGAGQPGQ